VATGIAGALYTLGVRGDTLTSEEKDQLDTLGYVQLQGIMSLELVGALRNRQAELLTEEGDRAGTEVHQERGTDRLSDLINKDPLYAVVISNPRVLAAIAHVLGGDLRLSSLNSRSALPGQGLQGLHADWGRLETPGKYQVCNSLWLLDDYSENNGATRVVPGTHLRGDTPGETMADPTGPHSDEVLLQGNTGDVLVMNSHTWHGGTLNLTDKPRRVMHGYFCRRHQPQQLDQKKYLRPETEKQLNEAQLTVLGILD